MPITNDQIRSLARIRLNVAAIAPASRALLVHLPLDLGQLLLVDEQGQLACLLEVHDTGEEGRRGEPLIAYGRHVTQHGRQQRLADAVADHVGLGLAGGLLNRIQGGQRPRVI